MFTAAETSNRCPAGAEIAWEGVGFTGLKRMEGTIALGECTGSGNVGTVRTWTLISS